MKIAIYEDNSLNREQLLTCIYTWAESVAPHELKRFLDYMSARPKHGADQFFLANTSRGIKRIRLADIYYFKAQRHFVELHGAKGTETFRHRFSDLIEKLSGQNFLVPHRSFLVNMAHVLSVNKTSITMTDEHQIPLSRNRQKSVTDAWLTHFNSNETDIPSVLSLCPTPVPTLSCEM